MDIRFDAEAENKVRRFFRILLNDFSRLRRFLIEDSIFEPRGKKKSTIKEGEDALTVFFRFGIFGRADSLYLLNQSSEIGEQLLRTLYTQSLIRAYSFSVICEKRFASIFEVKAACVKLDEPIRRLNFFEVFFHRTILG